MFVQWVEVAYQVLLRLGYSSYLSGSVSIHVWHEHFKSQFLLSWLAQGEIVHCISTSVVKLFHILLTHQSLNQFPFVFQPSAIRLSDPEFTPTRSPPSCFMHA